MDEKRVHLFAACLKRSPSREGVFNPWYDVDASNDKSSEAPEIRRSQLLRYLKERLPSVRFLLVGEAAGYQGAKFSGIPMTSERILLGGKRAQGIFPEHVFSGSAPKRTSREGLRKAGFSEPTATIVWDQIVRSGVSPYEFVLWNAFPWHPYNPKAGLLSNRTPSGEELEAGHEALTRIGEILAGKGRIIALGEKSFEALGKLGFESRKVRHPAQGGAARFREEFDPLMRI